MRQIASSATRHLARYWCTMLIRTLLPSVVALGLTLPVLAHAATACPQHFAAGQPPQIVKVKLRPKTRELCFEAFATLHSGLSRTPLYSAEHLTRPNLEAARQLPRKDSFHAEDRLPEGERAELSDYARSGYDRGHLAPNADMPTRSAQAESFSLANMVPQLHENNAGVWAGIEGSVRQLARDEGELYVVSGPAFIGTELKQVGHVLVPTHLWKVVYSPKQQRAGAYLIENGTRQDWRALSVAELEKLTGINPLPALSQQQRESAMQLPDPSAPQHDRKPKNPPPREDSTLEDLSRALLAFIGKLLKL